MPARAADRHRNRLGGRTAAGYRGSGRKAATATRHITRSAAFGPSAPPDRMDSRLLRRVPRRGGKNGAVVRGSAEGPGDDDRISPHRRLAGTHDAPAPGSHRRTGRRTGQYPRTVGHCRRVRRGPSRAGQSGRPRTCRGGLRPALRHRTPGFRTGRSERRAASGLRRVLRCGAQARLRTVPARWRYGIGQDGNLFRTCGGGLAHGAAGAGAVARNRLDRELSPSVRRTLRRRPHPVAFLAQIDRAQACLSRGLRRLGAGGGRSTLCPVPAVRKARADRRRRGA